MVLKGNTGNYLKQQIDWSWDSYNQKQSYSWDSLGTIHLRLKCKPWGQNFTWKVLFFSLQIMKGAKLITSDRQLDWKQIMSPGTSPLPCVWALRQLLCPLTWKFQFWLLYTGLYAAVEHRKVSWKYFGSVQKESAYLVQAPPQKPQSLFFSGLGQNWTSDQSRGCAKAVCYSHLFCCITQKNLSA